MGNCLACKTTLKSSRNSYCSNKCQNNLAYKNYIERWKLGFESGYRGKATYNFSAHVVRYMYEINNSACESCGWSSIHPVTKKVPLEIDHIDGDSSNNKPENLRLVCPNCHSLSAHHRNLNRGHGRAWRKQKHTSK